jgi:hypothetical protein
MLLLMAKPKANVKNVAKRPAAKPAGKKSLPSKVAKAASPRRKKPTPAQPVQGMTLAVTGYVAPEIEAVAEVRRELPALRDVSRLLRYGERFGAHKIEVRWLANPLPLPSGGFAIVDPAVKKSQRVLERNIAAGNFRCMLAIAVDGKESANAGGRLAAAVFHCGRPPISRWTVAHFAGTKPPAAGAALPCVVSTSGWVALQDAKSTAAFDDPTALPPPQSASGNMSIERRAGDATPAIAFAVKPGEYTAYWAVDEHDKAVCLVIDFDLFTQKDWKSKA